MKTLAVLTGIALLGLCVGLIVLLGASFGLWSVVIGIAFAIVLLTFSEGDVRAAWRRGR
ncbi:hypothetical protein [Skermania sp. ID1734]|uniref:hypothetical protein n=1 Tax=Skermania sp. ID1734 TaxID=2597516 RepID=UPI00163D9BA2|nr:hypothetical protein [Skermania sp. ID1734]